jgi:hypothetical protein
MKIIAVFLALICVNAHADLWFKQLVTINLQGEPPRTSSKEVGVQKSRLRADSQSAPGGERGLMIANERGFFSCAPAMKTCMKKRYNDGIYSIFGYSPEGLKLLSVTMTYTGTRRKLHGFICDDYKVERVMETESDDFTDGTRTTTSEISCYSPKFAQMFPPEAWRAVKHGIDTNNYSPQVKKALLDEWALGMPMKRKITSTSTSKDKKTPLPSMTLEESVTQVKTGTLNHHLFFVPKDFTVHDADQITDNTKQMRRSMNEFTAKAVRPTLGPEQLKKLKELRNSGQLSKEQQTQIDLILNQ